MASSTGDIYVVKEGWLQKRGEWHTCTHTQTCTHMHTHRHANTHTYKYTDMHIHRHAIILVIKISQVKLKTKVFFALRVLRPHHFLCQVWEVLHEEGVS